MRDNSARTMPAPTLDLRPHKVSGLKTDPNTMNSLLWFGILVTVSSPAWAENFYSPLLCAADEVSLRVQNPSDAPQDFWFQDLGTAPFNETYVSVKAKSQLNLELKDFGYSTNTTALSVKTQNSTLSFQGFCKSTQVAWKLESLNSPWKKISLLNSTPVVNLELANLSQQTNPVEVIVEDLVGFKTSQALTLPEAFAKTSLQLNLTWGVRSVKIQASGRWTGKAFDSLGNEISLEEDTVANVTPPVARYFLFQSQDSGTSDSFVVPMTKPALIQETLAQIQNPASAKLLVARIDKSLQGFNRDFSSTTKTPWSWRIVEAQNYADFAHISCDGTPGLVEERLNSWLIETGATICFWSYRVVRELNAQELMRIPRH
jgi:hypothetical protein